METPQIAEGMKREALLQTLRERIYFEKTIAASNAPDYNKLCTLAIPAWFVVEHGDKFRQSVLLWSGSRTEPWRVEVHLSCRGRPCAAPEAEVDGGWRAFAAANGLVVGDSLLFCVRAMSEFDVYVFRSLSTPVQASFRSEANVLGCRERKYGGSQGREIGEGVSGGEGDWKGKISFEKTLPAGAVSARFHLVWKPLRSFLDTGTPLATFPATFVRQHGDKIRERVVLQCVEDRRTWTVNVKAQFPRNQPQVTIRGGAWKPFAVSHGLVEGDRLCFTLVAMSKFEVLVIRRCRIPKDERLFEQGPAKRFKRDSGPAFSKSDWRPPKLLGSQLRNLACESNVKVERESGSEPYAQKGAAEDNFRTYSTEFGSLPSSSDIDFHNFERCGNLVNERTEGMRIADMIMRRSSGSRVIETLQDWKKNVSFEKTLTTGAVSRRFQLPFPKAFVRQHGHKIRKHAVLVLSVEDQKKWTVKVMAQVARKYLQVTIWGANWKAFVLYNGLVEGDRLTFTLVALSIFEVLILRSGGNADQANRPVKKFAILRSTLASEDSAGTFSGSASLQSPSDMDSHNFDRWYEGISMQVDQSKNVNDTDCHQHFSPTSSSE